MSVLLVYPTHENCSEVEDSFLADGINAATYPGRTTEDTEKMSRNCWNSTADQAEGMGFPVVTTVCALCSERARCLASGYLGELIDAEKAQVALCTHKQAEFTGIKEMMSRRDYVSIHENPIDLLRPRVDASESDLLQVKHVLERILNDPKFLDWFADDLRVDDEGNRYHDEEQEIRRDSQYQFCGQLLDMVEQLVLELGQATATTAWSPAAVMEKPQGIERTLFLAARICKAAFQGQPRRFVLTAASGELHSAAILVQKLFVKGGVQGEAFLLRSLTGFRDNRPGSHATIWFNDATLEPDRLQTILGQPVHDWTPTGRLQRQKKAVQVMRDITRRTKPRIFSNIIRGVMADRPQFKRIGVIGHKPHMAALKELEPEFACRIVKSTYFGSGADRSSNEWHEQCLEAFPALVADTQDPAPVSQRALRASTSTVRTKRSCSAGRRSLRRSHHDPRCRPF